MPGRLGDVRLCLQQKQGLIMLDETGQCLSRIVVFGPRTGTNSSQ